MVRQFLRSIGMLFVAIFVTLTAAGSAIAAPTTASAGPIVVRAAQVNCSPGVPPADCGAAANVYNYAVSHNFAPPPGLRGGGRYANSTGLLPAGGDYLEYRLSTAPGSAQRLVIDRLNPQGNSWFTADHYASFTQFYLLA